jgi:hypothetical protein
MNMIALYPTAKGLTLSDMLVPMVLADIKTMTRRMIPERLVEKYFDYDDYCNAVMPRDVPCSRSYEKEFYQERSPWSAGDFAYIRETHYRIGHWEKTGEKTRTGKDKWAFVPDSDRVEFMRPAGTYRKSRDRTMPGMANWYKRLARFMPKACARTVLEVVSVRVERLQDISKADCIAEGMEGLSDVHAGWHQSFAALWESINGSGSWEANPWVWVIEFRRVVNG